MKNFDQEFPAAKNLLQNAAKIVIISHRGPDGDTVGSNLALRRALQEQWGKEIISACVDAPPSYCDFLPDFDKYVNDFDLRAADLVISVDCGADYMLKFGETKPELFSGTPPLLNIDHHASNKGFGRVNIVDPDAASATLILYHFLKFCGFKIDYKIASCLLAGLYYDTGSFMHSNTTTEVLQVASDLMWLGADFKSTAKKQFRTMPMKRLRLLGKILERVHVNDKKLAVSALQESDFEGLGATPEDTTGAIDYLNSIPEGDFCCLLYQDKAGIIKGSFRSRVDNIDLSELAGKFGGGGHKKASGFSFPGKLYEVQPKIRIKKD